MSTTISTYGCCGSRDLFNSRLVPDWKNYFELRRYQQHCSIVSLMSDKLFEGVPLPEELEGDTNLFEKTVFFQDITKVYKQILIEDQPDYLILDFHNDAYNGFLEVGNNSYLTNREIVYKKIGYYKNFEVKEIFSVDRNMNEFIDIWMSKFDEFMLFMKQNCPNTKLIINKMKAVDVYRENGSLSGDFISEVKKDKQTHRRLELVNHCLALFEDYAIEKYNLQLLPWRREYEAQDGHPWGLCYFHYQPQYYSDKFKDLWNLVSNVYNPPTPLALYDAGGSTKTIEKQINNIYEIDQPGFYYLDTTNYLNMEDTPTKEQAGFFLTVSAKNRAGSFLQELTKASQSFSLTRYTRVVGKNGATIWNIGNDGNRTNVIPNVSYIYFITVPGEYYLSGKEAASLLDHPTGKDGWFLEVKKHSHNACIQILTKSTVVDEEFCEFKRIVNYGAKKQTKWREVMYH